MPPATHRYIYGDRICVISGEHLSNDVSDDHIDLTLAVSLRLTLNLVNMWKGE